MSASLKGQTRTARYEVTDAGREVLALIERLERAGRISLSHAERSCELHRRSLTETTCAWCGRAFAEDDAVEPVGADLLVHDAPCARELAEFCDPTP